MQSFGLQQNLSQTTKLTPTQIQVIRMLELPSIELNQRINEELQENPALEEGRDESVMDERLKVRLTLIIFANYCIIIVIFCHIYLEN